MRIIDVVNDWIYVVEGLITRDRREVHASRLKLYCDACLNIDQELFDQIAHDSAGYEVESFIGLRKRNDTWEVRVRWRGFTSGDETWEPLSNLLQDVPVLIKRWLRSCSLSNAAKAVQVLKILMFGEGEVSTEPQPGRSGRNLA